MSQPFTEIKSTRNKMSLYARGKREHPLLTEEGVYASSGPCWREDIEPAGFQCDPDQNPLIPTETATHKQYTHSQFETNTVQLKTRQKQTPSICSSSQDQCPSAGRVSGEALRDDVELFLPVIDRVCSEHHMTELCKPPLAAQPRAAGGAQHAMALTCCPSQPFFFFPTL